jgi:TatA/E family protein of Tat protein translocase
MHLAMVLVIALLVFGPKKLPEIGKELGKAIREFKRASRDVMDSFHDALEDRPDPVSTYDSAALSAYHAPEDTFHQAAQASSLEEPAAAADTFTVPGAAPEGTVERPAPSPVALPVDVKSPNPAPVPAEPGRTAADPVHAGAGPLRRPAGDPVSGRMPGDDADRKVGAAADPQDRGLSSGQDSIKRSEKVA